MSPTGPWWCVGSSGQGTALISQLKGMVYLTILQWVPDRQVMKRVYSTDPVGLSSSLP